jgi:trigger factor
VKVTKEKTEQCQVYLNVELAADEIEVALQKSYQTLVKKYRVPGFRQGKAPRETLERFLGEGALLEDALNNLVPDACEQAMAEQEISPLGRPEVQMTSTEPVTFQAIVPIAPTVELGDYASVRMKPEGSKFQQADVDKVIDDLRHQYAEFNPTDNAVSSGDMAAIDVTSNVGDEPFINQEGAQYQVIKDSPVPFPGFADAIIGMKRDEEKEFNLPLPEDFSNENLAGKEATFKVKVLEVKEEVMPELDDALAQRVEQANPRAETMAELKQQITDNLKEKAESAALIDYHDKLVTEVVNMSKAEFPPVMVESEVDRIIHDQMRQWQLGDKLEQYLKIIGKTEEELREELRPMAERRITRGLIVNEIAKVEKLEPTEAELEEEIAKLTVNAGEHKEEMEKLFMAPQYRGQLESNIISRKALEWLSATASGKAVAEADSKDAAPKKKAPAKRKKKAAADEPAE